MALIPLISELWGTSAYSIGEILEVESEINASVDVDATKPMVIVGFEKTTQLLILVSKYWWSCI